MGSFQDLTHFLKMHPNPIPDRRTKFVCMLQEFIAANENPNLSPNFRSQVPDVLDPLIGALKTEGYEEDEVLALSLLKVVKILSRKHENRVSMGDAGIRAVLRFLQKPKNPRIAGEGANVVLNICYEKENVDSVLRCNGIAPLVKFLISEDADLQANAAGAIQSICFQEKGRLSVRDVGAIPPILELLDPSCAVKVQTRAVGAIHNMSSDPDSIRIIRRQQGIPKLVELLRSDAPAICGSSAGALQNISREVASRNIIRDLGAIPLLANLLVVGDMQAQVCAAGALLNILGPELGEDRAGSAQRRGFGRLISCCLALSMAHEMLFDEPCEGALA
mmetsp:Transcript_7612/g.25214  ORF Transcript_7612/g.25214 Transcript_7612/m.25214 type:complete len:334 (+) Transcript_7612:62-1063(+)|eukprot:CAMPEP_0170145736 /NCGR_PEP_ID=MMETSP0033_2-20121228/25216_1 /TAXON_ID=195969 /ORGANISM="Dolichomastix tenuilepis, Strain CCMP3274" /LENGTH=333 /DNA_ID=CAMNT_0010382363 /DNA_START=45 /DNA_END=1046 /DNA_ORIENTATION=+